VHAPRIASVIQAAHAVGDDADDAQRRIEALEAEGNRAGTAGQRAGVEDQHDRRRQPLGELRRRAVLRRGVDAVEAAHHALDEGDVGPRRNPRDDVEHALAAAHPAVEIVGRPAGHDGVQAGVDEVRPDLEGLHGEAAAPQRRQQTERDRRLADAAGHARHDEDARHGRPLGPSTPADLKVAISP